MDPKQAGAVFKHLEKQKEFLWDAYRSMSHDLRRLKVEEEMLMRKFWELMEARGYVWNVDKEMLMHNFHEFMEAKHSAYKKKCTEAAEDEDMAAADEDKDQARARALVNVPSEERVSQLILCSAVSTDL